LDGLGEGGASARQVGKGRFPVRLVVHEVGVVVGAALEDFVQSGAVVAGFGGDARAIAGDLAVRDEAGG
jgi:hypothetical protein